MKHASSRFDSSRAAGRARRLLFVVGASLVLVVLGSAGAWGGDGAASSATVPKVGVVVRAQAIAAGREHTCAVTDAGGVECWGSNDHGQLGDGTTTDRLTPVAVTGLQSGVRAVATGGWHSCALTRAETVECWGENDFGQLGDGTTTDRHIPVTVSALESVRAIEVGYNHSCALIGGGGVVCWGRNSEGQLGDGTMTSHSGAVAVSGLEGVQAIAAGAYHSCALTSAGGVKCWGYNGYTGQLGDGTTTNRNSPVAVSGLDSGVRAIAAGWGHSCALTVGGAVECWGDNSFAQLGDGTGTNRLTPVAVSGLQGGVQAIEAGGDHSCALTNAGAVKCWGVNNSGQLGDGTTTGSSIAVAVSGLQSGVQVLSAGDAHNCTLTSRGGVKCWGWNNHGQLGDGSASESLKPVAVYGLGALSVTVQVAGRGTVSLADSRCSSTCTLEQAEGAEITLTAAADKGWRLKNWGGACSGSAPRCTLQLTEDVTVTAKFALAHTVLSSLSATRNRNSVLVRWRTSQEAESRGFNLYRVEKNGKQLRANKALIKAKGSETQGAAYSFLDRRVPKSVRRYRLQELKGDGTKIWYGPVAVKR